MVTGQLTLHYYNYSSRRMFWKLNDDTCPQKTDILIRQDVNSGIYGGAGVRFEHTHRQGLDPQFLLRKSSFASGNIKLIKNDEPDNFIGEVRAMKEMTGFSPLHLQRLFINRNCQGVKKSCCRKVQPIIGLTHTVPRPIYPSWSRFACYSMISGVNDQESTRNNKML